MGDVNSYIRFSDNIKVNLVKIEGATYNDITEALAQKEEKTDFTILFNDFKDEIDAYYFSNTETFSNNICSVYKKTYSQPYFDFITRLKGSINFIDYNIHNHDNYEYMAVISMPKSDGNFSYRIYENKDNYNKVIYSPTDWENWSICNIEETTTENVYTKTGNTWILGMNLNEERLTQNLSVTSWDTLSQYPKLSFGSQDYISSSVTTLLGQMHEVTVSKEENSQKIYQYTERLNDNRTYDQVNNHLKNKTFEDSYYSREIEKYNAWVKFCSDGSLKLLKDTKGNSWVVQITSSPEASYNVIATGMPTTVTFNWSEVMNVEDITIIS